MIALVNKNWIDHKEPSFPKTFPMISSKIFSKSTAVGAPIDFPPILIAISLKID